MMYCVRTVLLSIITVLGIRLMEALSSSLSSRSMVHLCKTDCTELYFLPIQTLTWVSKG